MNLSSWVVWHDLVDGVYAAQVRVDYAPNNLPGWRYSVKMWVWDPDGGGMLTYSLTDRYRITPPEHPCRQVTDAWRAMAVRMVDRENWP
jgi:hypothetical protein